MTVDERVQVGTKLLFRLLLIVLGLWFLYLIRDVVLLIFLSVLTSAVLSPAVTRLRNRGLSRTGAVILTYGVVFIGMLSLVAILVPLFVSELREFAGSWPLYADRIGTVLSGVEGYFRALGVVFDKHALFLDLERSVGEGFGNIFSTTVSVFSGLISFLGFFFLSLYLSLEEKGIEKFFLLVTPDEYHSYALSIAERMQGKVSQWLFGQGLIMLIVFAIYFFGLSLLGVPYALALAFFGGLMEIIPYIGPVIAAIPGVVLALLVSPALGLATFVFYVVAHQLEGHIIAPQVLRRSAGLNPVVLIIAALIGAELGGPLGILLAIPMAMLLSLFVEDLLEKKKS